MPAQVPVYPICAVSGLVRANGLKRHAAGSHR
jgi:hypothetical protein